MCTIVALWFGLLASHVAKVVKSAVQSVYKVVICLSVVRIEQTLVAVVDQCTCASGIVTVNS